jgi:sortase A
MAVTHAVPATASTDPVSQAVQPPPSGSPPQESTAPAGLLDIAARAYGPRLIVRIDIPAIEVHTPVVAVGWVVKEAAEGRPGIDWDSPGALAGWVVTSALPGDGSNTILYGHNNLYTSIFKDLGDLKTGDQVSLTTGEKQWTYTVYRVLFLQTTFADKQTLESYEKYLGPGTKEQVTLISCWPPLSNTHRVIVLAEPEK